MSMGEDISYVLSVGKAHDTLRIDIWIVIILWAVCEIDASPRSAST